jgi:hypothetical protein
MITLTEEQRRELDLGEPVQVLDPQTQQTYVLVRADDYERLRSLLAADDMPDVGALINEEMAEDDANDPGLESYQQYRKER